MWFIGTEMLLVLFIRDSCLLTFNVMVFNMEDIADWQKEGLNLAMQRSDLNLSIAWPMNALLSSVHD